MKLHLPIPLLTAILCASGLTQAAEFGAGTYTYTTDSDGTINSTFIGDCTGGSFGTSGQGYKKAGWVAGIPVSDTDRYAPHTNVTIGDGTTATRVNAAIAVGVRGYASDGNKSITVLNNAYAGTIYGAYNLNTGHKSGLAVKGAESYSNNGKYFAPKATKDNTISITLDSGSALQVFGGMSQVTTPIPAEMKAAYNALGSAAAAEAYALEDPAWALNEKVEINIINGKVGVTADGNAHPDLITSPTINVITGAGMGGASINNTVSINVDGEDSVVYGSIYAGASEFTNTSYDATTYGRIRGYVENTKVTINNGTINGSVHGGGMEGGLVKKDTRVTLAGGQINGDVYGAGSGDEVAGNTQVVIKGEGATVTGTIYGGGSNNAVVNGDRILTFDSYTANPDADGYATVDWNQYQDFNSLELQNSKVNLGQVGTEYESLKLCGSQAIADSVRNGEAVKLDMTSYLPGGTTATIGSSLTVNSNIQLAEGSRIWGTESVSIDLGGFVLNADASTSTLTANSITGTGTHARYGNLTATEGNINLQKSEIENSDLIAENGTVTLTNSTMNGGDIVAKSFFNDGSNSVVDNVTVSSALLASPEPGKKAGLVNTGSLTINGNLTVSNNSSISQEGDGTSLVIKGDVKNSISVLYNLGGKVEFGGNVTLNHSYLNGSIEFSGGEGTEAKLTGGFHYMVDPIGYAPVDCTITHSGAGNVAYGDITIDGKLTINQSGSGEFSVENFAGSMLELGSNLHINQSGTGKIVVDGMLMNDSTTLVQTGGGTFENRATASIDSITATGEGGTVVNSNTGKLTVKGDATGADFVQTGTGTLRFEGNMSGRILEQTNGVVEFAGAENTVANVITIGDGGSMTGKLVHSGSGVVNIHDDIVPIGGDYTVEQTGNGEMNVNGINAFMGTGASIKQTGKGTINVGQIYNIMGSGVTLDQSGGGTVAIWSYADLASLTVEGNSTFHIEKGASVTVETLALSDATLSFTEGADSLTISESGAITALDGVMFELILEESAAPLFEGGPDTTVDFSFTVLDNLANLTAGEDLVTAMQQAFTVDQLQLLGANANGALFDLIIQDATMEYTNGAVTISGKASIPEPTTATLSLLALAALAARRRRR